jgi:hypothetical protein
MKNLLLFLIIIFSSLTFASLPDTLQIRNNDAKILALRLTDQIELDGKLNESIWATENGFQNFIQLDPTEGAAPTEKTVLLVAYDDNALYIGARMYDSAPDSIVARLARRDEWITSDHVTIYLDPYYDKRSGYFFTLNAAGTLIDGVLYNDSWDDESWDGVWEGKVNMDKEGWTAEMRIPFSQMRFSNNQVNIWGINFRRNIARKNELDYLVFIPKNESGFVSHFAELKGMQRISTGGQMELIPYVTARAEYIQYEAGDPFNSGANYLPGAGADFKMGVGSNLTLNATVNPDFGQVEIDPAVINLSDVETFFPEKRPFFIEGSTIFNFGYGGARNYWGFNWGNPDFLYSRRIGRQPQGSIPDEVDYVDYPTGTHIIGAAKLTGKLGESWNFGTVQNITKREFARVSIDGVHTDLEIEPLTYYGIVRGQKEINEGRQGIGLISTATVRGFNDDRLRDEINKSALSLGLDGWTFIDDSKTWVLAGWSGMSYVNGNTTRMISLQESSRHYFQRPDADYLNVDSSATSLKGFAGRFHLNKQKGNFFVNTAFGFITPSFDVNDVGFMFRADRINWHAGAGYYWSDPTDLYRYLEAGAAIFQNYDFGGNVTWQGIFHFGFIEFLNYYSVDWDLFYNPESYNNTRTRGGPLTLNPIGYGGELFLRSDNRNDWIVSLGGATYNAEPSYDWNVNVGLEFRFLSNLVFIISPQFSRVFEYAQYVDTFDDPTATNTFGKRYVFAELDQKTFSASLRLNWIFTPKLSLQLYMQPLISAGDYTNYKELAYPGTYDFNNFGEGISTYDPDEGTADPDGDGPAEPIEIGNPDFNLRSLRGNAVLRWEYLPGSVIYFVWTQTRSAAEEIGEFQFDRSFKKMMLTEPDNIFMIKVTYWFNM